MTLSSGPSQLENMPVLLRNDKIEISCKSNPDSGAAKTIAQLSTAKNLNANILPFVTPLRLKTANGHDMKVEGHARLEILFGKSRIFSDVVVSSDLDCPLIIGRDDLMKLGVLPPTFPFPEQ